MSGGRVEAGSAGNKEIVGAGILDLEGMRAADRVTELEVGEEE